MLIIAGLPIPGRMVLLLLALRFEPTFGRDVPGTSDHDTTVHRHTIKYQIHLKKVLYFSDTGFLTRSEHRLRFSRILGIATAAGASRRRSPKKRLQLFIVFICGEKIRGWIGNLPKI